MDKIADSVAVLLADLPSHKDSVRVLLNQEVSSHSSAPRVYAALSRANGVPQLPPAIRATVWIENLREPKARDLFDSLNARDGLATVAVEYPDITRRCQDVLSTSYVECQGRTVLTGAMRTVMSYLHATQGPQELALYRCLIPLVYVLGPTVDGPAKVVCARARLVVGDCLAFLTLFLVRRWRRLLRFSNSPGRDCHLEYVGFKTVVCAPRCLWMTLTHMTHSTVSLHAQSDPTSRSATERFALAFIGHLKQVDPQVLHHMWTLYGGAVEYHERDDARRAHAMQVQRRAQRASRRAARAQRIAALAEDRAQKRRRRAARATKRAEAGVARRELMAKHEAAREQRRKDAQARMAAVEAAKAAPMAGESKGVEGEEEKVGVVKIKERRRSKGKGEEGEEGEEGKGGDGKDSDGDGDGDGDRSSAAGKGGNTGRSSARSTRPRSSSPRSKASTSPRAPVVSLAEVEAEIAAREREEEARFAAQLDALPQIASDTESDGHDSDVSDVSADTAKDVELKEDDTGVITDDVEVSVRGVSARRECGWHMRSRVATLCADALVKAVGRVCGACVCGCAVLASAVVCVGSVRVGRLRLGCSSRRSMHAVPRARVYTRKPQRTLFACARHPCQLASACSGVRVCVCVCFRGRRLRPCSVSYMCIATTWKPPRFVR